MPLDTKPQAWTDLWLTSRDGLKLYGRRYGGPNAGGKPVLCLAGLTRNSRDFHDLAVALSTGETPRPVYTLDSRGRGLSQHDPDWKNYVVPVEVGDVMDAVTTWGIHGATVVGTSRGGLISMLLAAAQPTAIGAVVLNDIGPVIEREGLVRISTYVGRMPVPLTWDEAAETVRAMNVKAFPAVPREHWAEVARAWFNDDNGRPAAGYDGKIARAMSVSDGPMPQLWPQFEALGRVPMLVIRGDLSDILSAATVTEMQRRHPSCATLTIAGQGHAPLLKDAGSITAIRSFLDAADAGKPVVARWTA